MNWLSFGVCTVCIFWLFTCKFGFVSWRPHTLAANTIVGTPMWVRHWGNACEGHGEGQGKGRGEPGSIVSPGKAWPVDGGKEGVWRSFMQSCAFVTTVQSEAIFVILRRVLPRDYSCTPFLPLTPGNHQPMSLDGSALSGHLILPHGVFCAGVSEYGWRLPVL